MRTYRNDSGSAYVFKYCLVGNKLASELDDTLQAEDSLDLTPEDDSLPPWNEWSGLTSDYVEVSVPPTCLVSLDEVQANGDGMHLLLTTNGFTQI